MSDWHATGSAPCAWATPAVGNFFVQRKHANRGIDINGIVHGLRSAGFTCGVFAIEGSESANSYGNFQKLLEAAKGTNIKLWVVIIPSSEGSDSFPYRSDYAAWSRALARLSLKYKNFRSFNNDDIDQDVSEKTLTHDYLCRIYTAKKEVHPDLLFLPAVYDLDRRVNHKRMESEPNQHLFRGRNGHPGVGRRRSRAQSGKS